MAQVKKAGKDKVRLIGKVYEQTVKVDETSKKFIEENAPSIFFDATSDLWRVTGKSTLQRSIVAETKKLPKRARIQFYNGDRADYRTANLVTGMRSA